MCDEQDCFLGRWNLKMLFGMTCFDVKTKQNKKFHWFFFANACCRPTAVCYWHDLQSHFFFCFIFFLSTLMTTKINFTIRTMSLACTICHPTTVCDAHELAVPSWRDDRTCRWVWKWPFCSHFTQMQFLIFFCHPTAVCVTSTSWRFYCN